LLLDAFACAYAVDNNLRLILAGKGSEAVPLPETIAPAVERVGYVSLDELINLYRRSALFVLLSDYEAFGLPIAEALCCGSQVLLNRQEALVKLFGDMPGVNITDNTDIERSAAMMRQLAADTPDRRHIAQVATERFQFSSTYGMKRDILLASLRTVTRGLHP
jgi:glycosyltransferase involved in cell wall biosynthesis